MLLQSYHPFGILLQTRRDNMIIEKQMIEDEPRRGEMIIENQMIEDESRRDNMIIEKQMIEDEPRRGEMIIEGERFIPNEWLYRLPERQFVYIKHCPFIL